MTTEKLLLAVNTGAAQAQMATVPFTDLAHNPMVVFPSGSRPNFVDKVMALCNERGFSPQIAQEVGDAVTAVALVASGFGMCLVPESATTLHIPGVVYRPFSDAPDSAFVDLSCIFRDDDDSPLLEAFLDSARQLRLDGALAQPAQPTSAPPFKRGRN